MKNLKEQFAKVVNDYGFEVKTKENEVALYAKNTDGKSVKWIKYIDVEDVVCVLGNTDNLNIWLCETRKDLEPNDLVSFVNELNQALHTDIKLSELVDPEDWQEIAQIENALEDERYI